ncbi:MAG: NAD(P)H-hydrate dehydratase, partial [Mobilitalea sp.]
AVLMERAAYEITVVMKEKILKTDRILVLCGPGNNGGDGIAAGRILYLQGYSVAILFIGDENKCSKEMKAQFEIAKNLGIQIKEDNDISKYNIIIDAIFGIGLSRQVTGKQEEIIKKLNAENHIVYSVDIPSGISSDNGKIMNAAVKANETITFGYQKQGLLLYPGADYTGKISVVDIGFPEIATKHSLRDTFYYEQEDLQQIPVRNNYSNKGSFGKVLIIAGSSGMSGAAYLSAKSAYRTGAGLVKILTAADNRVILQTSLPEALFAAYDETGLDNLQQQQKINEIIAWASVVVIGPGLGLSETAEQLLLTVIEKAKVPVVFDADAITLLSFLLDKQGVDRQERIKYLSGLLKDNMILTPHLKELSKLLGVEVNEIVNNAIDTARQCSYNNKLIVAMKDARTIVTQQQSTYINVSGNNGMATGGSGDVLTGIIAALIAQGMEPYKATCLGVYLHGLAGDIAAKEKGRYSMMASDIINSIEKVLINI